MSTFICLFVRVEWVVSKRYEAFQNIKHVDWCDTNIGPLHKCETTGFVWLLLNAIEIG
jgi:hypothetical protein